MKLSRPKAVSLPVRTRYVLADNLTDASHCLIVEIVAAIKLRRDCGDSISKN